MFYNLLTVLPANSTHASNGPFQRAQSLPHLWSAPIPGGGGAGRTPDAFSREKSKNCSPHPPSDARPGWEWGSAWGVPKRQTKNHQALTKAAQRRKATPPRPRGNFLVQRGRAPPRLCTPLIPPEPSQSPPDPRGPRSVPAPVETEAPWEWRRAPGPEWPPVPKVRPGPAELEFPPVGRGPAPWAPERFPGPRHSRTLHPGPRTPDPGPWTPRRWPRGARRAGKGVRLARARSPTYLRPRVVLEAGARVFGAPSAALAASIAPHGLGCRARGSEAPSRGAAGSHGGGRARGAGSGHRGLSLVFLSRAGRGKVWLGPARPTLPAAAPRLPGTAPGEPCSCLRAPAPEGELGDLPDGHPAFASPPPGTPGHHSGRDRLWAPTHSKPEASS